MCVAISFIEEHNLFISLDLSLPYPTESMRRNLRIDLNYISCFRFKTLRTRKPRTHF